MDAMAHINYQMRQNYKLFAWRYLVLGNIGAFTNPDTSPSGRQQMNILSRTPVAGRSLCPNAGSNCLNRDCAGNFTNCPHAVCTIHPLFSVTWQSDNTHVCQQYLAGVSAKDLPPLTRTAGPVTTYSVLAGNDQVRRLRERLRENCSDVGYQNWMVTASMYLAFLRDQRKRAIFVKDNLFPLLQGGKEIGGQGDISIVEGVRKTIQKNLTYVNYKKFENVDPSFSVVQSNTGGDPAPVTTSTGFDDFFEWDEISSIPLYVQNTKSDDNPLGDGARTFCERTVQTVFQCDPGGSNPHLSPLTNVDSGAMHKIANHQPDPDDLKWCEILKAVWSGSSDPERVAGFHKKAAAKHLGVKVEVAIPYRGQLFFPLFGEMELKAKAYAKPFGATFGGSKLDLLIPRIPPGGGGLEMFNSFPNYSRFSGDRYGLTDAQVQWAWGVLFAENPRQEGRGMRGVSERQGRTFNNYSDLPDSMDAYQDPMFLHYDDPGSNPNANAVQVQLSNREIFRKTMRIYEEMAIAPDPFDVANYTILPNYMLTLYPKLKKTFNNQYVPADLGHTQNSGVDLTEDRLLPPVYINNARSGMAPKFRLNYIERQIIYAHRLPQQTPPFPSLGINQVLPYRDSQNEMVESVNGLLTSWDPEGSAQPCSLDDREVKLTFTLQGGLSDGLERKLIPSHCLKGGRTGFSVKIVHPNAL